MAKNTIKDYMRSIDRAVETIAYIRRMAESDGLDMDEFDKALNDLCQKKHGIFAKMDKIAMGVYGVRIIIEAGKGREFLEKMMEGDD